MNALPELEYVVREPSPGTEPAPALFLLHGFGSNEKDLIALADQLPDDWLVVSVRAPIALGSNRFKWYDVGMVDQQIKLNVEDEEKSRLALLQLIDRVVAKYQADANKVVAAGFSQGANMAVGLALTAPKKVLAAGCFSGRFLEEIKPVIRDKDLLKSRRVFLAHGTKDNMLPIRYAEENQEILEGFGMEVTRSTDQTGHTISGKQLGEFSTWLSAL